MNTALPDAGVATGVLAYSTPDTKVTEVIQPAVLTVTTAFAEVLPVLPAAAPD